LLLEGPAIDVTGRKRSFSKDIKIDTPLHNVRILGGRVVVVDVEIGKL